MEKQSDAAKNNQQIPDDVIEGMYKSFNVGKDGWIYLVFLPRDSRIKGSVIIGWGDWEKVNGEHSLPPHNAFCLLWGLTWTKNGCRAEFGRIMTLSDVEEMERRKRQRQGQKQTKGGIK
jgi:hypothetical protein